MKRPNKIPPKRDKITFFEYRAKAIASKEGRSESGESSMSVFLELYAHKHKTSSAKFFSVEFTLFLINFFKA